MQSSNDILFYTIRLILLIVVLVWLSQVGLHKFTAMIEDKLVQATKQE